MASTNLILAVPSADSAVNYDLPKNESATLSFAPEDIDGLKLDANGGLVISFVEGGQVTLNNFQSFIDNGNTLSLADGTKVDPSLLFNALGGTNDNPFPSDTIKIGIPAENTTEEITLEPGKKYVMDFDLSETQGADVKDGKMTISFENGGKIVIDNYETSMASATPPELSLASKTCIVTGDELITNIQQLAKTGAVEEEIIIVEEDTKSKSKIADADMAGKEDIGPGDQTKLGYKVAEIEPAAGEEEALANIEPAAGGPAGGARNSGYGFNSAPGADPFAGKPDIGPLGQTSLGYTAPTLTPSKNINIPDNNPPAPDSGPITIAPGAKFVDETNLAGGNIQVGGKIDVDFGADGPGGIFGNGSFSSGGSKLGGALTHNGETINVTYANGKYVGTTTGGKVIFDLVIDKDTGNYTFTQYDNLDHANGNDPNDQITLNFGIIAYDGDGDSVQTKVQIVVADDAPSASGDTKTLDETDLGPISANGSITVNFGQDGPGRVETSGTFTPGGSLKGGVLTSSGVPVVVTHTATGYEGKANGVTVFTLVLNPATGAYTYTQFKNLDHADGSDPNDVITLTFGTNVVDYDGDKAPAPIVINVVDDGPDFQSCGCGPQPDKGLEVVDETNLKNGNLVESGKLDADFGGDVPGSYAFKAGSFVASGSMTNNALTHNGVPVVVTLENGVFVGKAGNLTIFTLTLNPTTGDYTYTQFDNFDHADGNDPNDVITMDFGVIASDADGDSMTGGIRIHVKDDAPVANNDVNDYDISQGQATGNVVSGLNGGPGASDDVSTDAPNKVTKIAFGGNEIDVPANGSASIDGDHGTLTIHSDGSYTYVPFANNGGGGNGGGSDKVFTPSPVHPDFQGPITPAEQQALGIQPGNFDIHEGDVVSIKLTQINASYQNTAGAFTIDSSGNLVSASIFAKNVNAVNGQSFNYTAGTNAQSFGMFLIGDGNTANAGYPAIDFSVGTVSFVYNYGQAGERVANVNDSGANVSVVYTLNGVETVLQGQLIFTTENGTSTSLNPNGNVQVISDVDPNDSTVLRVGFEDKGNLGDKDYNDVIFNVSIDDSCGCGCGPKPDITDVFTYTLVDSDGDKDTATLTLNGKDLTDDIPEIVTPAVEIVDETNLSGGALTETGTISVDFGGDAPGTVAGNGAFTSTGSKLNNNLTSGGVAVNVTYANGVYTGKAGNTTVFTLTVAADGSYTFKLFEQLDHANGSDPNDIINLNFGIEATDCDGDKSQTTLVVQVKDDAPVANDDNRTVGEGETIVGNVTTNDTVGQDTPGTVTQIIFGNTTYPLTGANTTIVGQYGTLVINNTGAYTYTANSNNPDGTDTFTYTLRDGDGDTDPAILKISVTPDDDTPAIVKPAVEILDETNLVGGTLTETGSVTANFFGDGPGTFHANNSFTSSGSRLNNALTHQGVAVNVTLAGNTYTGMAGNVKVFELVLATDGTYTFRLFQELDHANGSDPNDIINLDFGVIATDADGDNSLPTTITVQIKDDAPIANDDGHTVTNTAVSGNVTANDTVGQDTPGTVTQVVFNGQTYNLTTTNTTINGTYGTLVINSTGAYTYTPKSGADGIDSFTYTLRDRDGDTDTAVLSFDTDNDTTPVIIKPAVEILDETNLVGGTLTETGSVTANFFGDGPGTFHANGSFTSSGSRLNNALTHQGTAVNVTLAGNTYTGMAGNVKVFEMVLNTDGSYTFRLFQELDHADGSNPNDIINLDFGVYATDADGDNSQPTTITVQIKDDAPIANDDGRVTADGGTVTGNVTSNDVVGQDTPGTVIQIIFNGNTYNVPSNGSNTTINGTYGTLTINNTGAYTYVAKTNVDGQDNFTYILRDRDGDTDPAILCIEVNDRDDVPQIIKPAVEILDETNLSGGTLTETGSVTANFFSDGPGTFSANGSFTSSGSRLNNQLTHQGVPVNVTLAGNTYTGMAGNVKVFELVLAADGSYTFRLFQELDHADGNNPNDIINLDFGVIATDADGDNSLPTTITVQIKDDAPNANDDGRTTNSGGETITGNVTSNDVVGQDTPGTVTQVVFNGTTYTVPANGSNVTIPGTYGTLTINNTGLYTYTSKTNVDGVDQFIYTLRDRDGDTDTACLSIDVNDVDTIPSIVKPATEILDETNLVNGTLVETGSVTANFYEDGPGTFHANGSFTSSGSRLNNQLTHNGTAVNVTLSGNTYTGMAGNVKVFELVLNTDGSYTFRLFQQLDHKDGTNPDDIINLDFGVIARDADGDNSLPTTITVQIKDDAPITRNDYCTLYVHEKTLTSNVLSNDTIGQDTPGRVVAVTFNGQTYNVPSSGTVTITTIYGTLLMASDGSYTYTIAQNLPNNVTQEFSVRVADYDGDTSTSTLQMNLLKGGTTGTEGNDTIHGTSGDDVINGLGGNDMLWGEGGHDTINGGDGWDSIDGGIGNDIINGGAGNDLLIGREGNDTIRGGTGDDEIYGDYGTSATYAGNDTLYGEDGNDYIYGGAGTDYIDGGSGNDILYGGDGVDTILGGTGNDDIIGEKGNDILTGGAGADKFWFMNVNEGVDTIKDFSIAQGDKLELSNVISNFDPVTDAINQFVFATHVGGNTIISVNNNGTGAAGATQIAVLENVNVSVNDLYNNGSIIH